MGQIDLIESESRVANLRLQRHLCVIEEPVLGVERHVVEALHEGYIDADVELWLELRAQLDQELFPFHESKLCFLEDGSVSILVSTGES